MPDGRSHFKGARQAESAAFYRPGQGLPSRGTANDINEMG
jgi:hypothetical protein